MVLEADAGRDDAYCDTMARAQNAALLLEQEANHRVANSLQLVSSLLSLQRRKVQSAEARDALQAAAGCIVAVGSIHRQLYAGGRAERMDLADYLRELAANLQSSCNCNRQSVRITVTADSLSVHSGDASLVGIIVNELVMNAVKHAYPIDDGGQIDIRLQTLGHHGFRLEVEDYGASLAVPEGPKSEGLGSRIIETASRRLGGRYEYVASDKGTRFSLTAEAPAQNRPV